MTFALPHRGRRPRDDARVATELERSLASLSADEIVAAMGLGGAPLPVRAAARAAFTAVSVPLGRALARFDHGIETLGVSQAAAGVLGDLGARWERRGPRPPTRGPLLVVSNHPGAYDALVLLAALERNDVAIVAADRRFLRAMPGLRAHLLFVPEAPSGAALGRALGLRRALGHMARGGAVLHFGAGLIEPDPAFLATGTQALAPWQPGTGALVRGAARSAGFLVPAMVAGVHSARAKRLFITRVAERHGLTTLAPLLQVSLRRYRDVEAVVRFGEAVPSRRFTEGSDARIAARVREQALALAPLSDRPPPRGHEHVTEGLDRAGPRR
jgi:hypothetical protein